MASRPPSDPWRPPATDSAWTPPSGDSASARTGPTIQPQPVQREEPDTGGWLGALDRWGERRALDLFELTDGFVGIDPSTYYGWNNYGPDAQPVQRETTVTAYQRPWYERMSDAASDAASIAGTGEVGYLQRRLIDSLDLDDAFLASRFPEWTAEQREAYRDQRMRQEVLDRREASARRDFYDPNIQGDDSWYSPGSVGRFLSQMVGDMAGNANPTYLIGGPARGWLARAGTQGTINASIDAGVQFGEMGEELRDQFDPLQTSMQFGAGFGMQALGDLGAAGMRRIFSDRAAPANASPDEGLVDVTLDGLVDSAPPDVAALLQSVGMRPEQFSSPDIAAAMADRISAARERPLNVDPVTLQERADLTQAVELGEMDPSYMPGPLAPRVVPEGVTMQAFPEGTIRSDDMGGIVGLMRNLAANQNVIDQATARAADNPTLRAILESSANRSQMVGPLFQRLQQMIEAPSPDMPSGPLAMDPSLALPPQQRPTIEQARGDTEGIVLPVQGRISSAFGPRSAPTAGASTNHLGIDIAAARGTPVAAPEGGTVIMAGEAGANGNLVRIDHGNGVISSYAHLDSINVRIGQRVGRGDVLGGVGSTGRSTGNHLHYGIRVNGEAVDPQSYRFQPTGIEGDVYRAPAPVDDPFAGGDGMFERRNQQASPTNREFEEGRVFQDRDGIFTDDPSRGDLYTSPMGTGGNERPFRDVPRSDDRPEARGPEGAGPPPEGTPPRAGTSYFEDVNQQRMDDLMREYEASSSRRRERQSQDRAQQDASQTYRNKYGQKPAQGEDGFWRTTDDGIVADGDGNPVAFRNARDAARWATANEMAGDFELETWATNSERVILRRRGNSTYGQSRPETGENGGNAGDSQEFGNPAQLPPPRNDIGASSSPDAPETGGGGDAPAATSSQAAPSQEGATKPVTPSRAPLTGKSETVVTPAGREVETQFEVRELADVHQASGIRQPRDRGRDSSDMQVTNIAAKLDPNQLKGNRQAAHGAPIIGPDGVIEVGNGRTRAIERAYAQHPERIAEYQQMIRDEGFDIEGFDQPVLVRRRTTEMDEGDMRAWVNEAQESGTMAYSAPERAKADAGAVSSDTLSLYRGGDIDSAANRDFIKAWSNDTRADTNSLRASDGSLSAEGKARVRASILAKAFDDETLIAKLLGDADTNIKAIGDVLLDAAPKFAQVRDAVADGRIAPEFDISGKVAEMAGLISRARSQGEKLPDLIGQSDMFGKNVDAVTESLVGMMFKDAELKRPRSKVRLQEGFDFYLDGALRTEEGAGMFGEALKPLDILEAARGKLDAKDNPPGTGTFFRLTEADGATGKRGRKVGLNNLLERTAKDGDVDADMRSLAEALVDRGDRDASVQLVRDMEAAGSARPALSEIEIRKGGDTETLLHEAIHVRLMRRYGVEFDELRPNDLGAGPAMDLIRTYNAARKRYGKYGFWNTRAAGFDVRYALSSVDEFVAMALTNRNVQRWLQRGTMWERLVDGFRKVLGLPARLKPALDDVLRSGRELIDASKGDSIRLDGPRSEIEVNRIVDTDGLKRDVEAVRRAVSNPKATATNVAKRIKDGVSWTMFTADARGRGVADRIESKAAHELLDHFHAQAGKLDDAAVRETFHESVQKYANGRSQRAFRALEGITGNKVKERRVADLLRYPNRRAKATPDEIEAAKTLRELFKETLEYRKAAGEEIGEVGDGYFPRWLDVERVLADPDKFKSTAERLYRDIGLTGKEAEVQAQSWLEHTIDTYAGIDGGLDIFNAAGDTVGARTAQARQFGKKADTLLADFYQDDVLAVAAQYFHGSARKAEMARRFGKKGAVGSSERKAWERDHGDKTQLDVLEERIREDARAYGADGAGAMSVLRDIYGKNLGRLRANMSARQRATVAWAHTWTQLGVMDRAVLTSLAELAMGFTRGGLKRGLPFVRDSMKEYVRAIRRAPPSDAARWAEAIGVAQDAIVNTALTARASIEGGTAKSQKVLQGFYQATTLHQYTEGTRIAAAKMGREFIDQLAHDMESSSARVKSRASRYLGELGVTDPAAFAKSVREGRFSLDAVLRETSDGAREYATALIRFTNQTVMRPTRAEKPVWASHPVGSMFFSLMSYSYGFKKNVLDRVGRLAIAGVKERDPTLLQPALGLAILTGWQYLNDTYIRTTIFGGGPDEDETAVQAGLRAADRAGLTGALSPIINAFTGIRYQRSLGDSLLGPVIGRPAEALTKLGRLAVNNSPNTNTAERAAAGAVYDNVLEPALDGLAAARLLGATRTAAILGTGTRDDKGVLPADREWFISAVAGEKKGGN